MTKKFLLLFLFFLFLPTETYPVEVSTPEFPIFVKSDDRALANRTISYCNEYVKSLQKTLRFKRITPITVFLGSKDYFFYKHMLTSKIYIASDNPDWKTKLTEQISISIVKDLSIDDRENLSATKIPFFVPIGIAGIYLKSKINPSYKEIHKKLVNSNWIPLQNLIKMTAYPKNDRKKYFVLESIYLMEQIQFNSKKDIVKNFLHNYAYNPDSSLDFLAKTLGFDTPEKLESFFYKKVQSKKVIYNIVSSQNKPFKKQNILKTLNEIMTFEYDDHKNNKKIILRANDIKIDDLPYISDSAIEEKIIRLRMINDSGMSKEATKISYYIKALRHLQQGDYEKYYDNFYMAK